MNYEVKDVEEFGKTLEKIARRYPTVLDTVESLFEDLEKGKISGNAVPRLKLKGDKVYKTRLENPDANKGKSGGFKTGGYHQAMNRYMKLPLGDIWKVIYFPFNKCLPFRPWAKIANLELRHP